MCPNNFFFLCSNFQVNFYDFSLKISTRLIPMNSYSKRLLFILFCRLVIIYGADAWFNLNWLNFADTDAKKKRIVIVRRGGASKHSTHV